MKPEKQKEKKITKNTSIAEAIHMYPESAGLLTNAGMHCIGCPMAQMESIEDGCLSHGMTKKSIDELIKKLNKLKWHLV